MQWWEYVVLLAFVAFVCVVFVGVGAILLRGAIRAARRQPAPPRSAGRRWARRTFLTLGAAEAACGAYAYLIEPYHLTQTRIRLACPHLPAGAAPVRIAFVSDLHCVGKTRLEDRIVEAAAAQKPDLVLFGGDALSREEGLDNLRRCLGGLARIAPTYAVRGNWDRELPTPEFFRQVNVTELRDDVLELDLGGRRICLAGVGIHYRYLIPLVAARLPRPGPASGPVIFLHHYPDAIYQVAGRADLYLCGHTHGGQVALPFYGALITLSRFGKRFEYGRYDVNGTTMFVTRGVGMEGNHTPAIRFLAPPELVFIEIAPAAN